VARSFDGSADYLLSTTVPVSGYLFTMACWVYVNSLATSPYVFQFGNSGDAASRLGLHIETSGALSGSTRNGANTRTWTTTATLSTGTWNHIQATFSSETTVECWLNGVSTGSYVSAVDATFASFNRVCLGALPRSTISNFLNGYIAEAAIWNSGLAGGSAAMLTAGMSPLFVRPDLLVAYWPLHGRGGAGGNEESWVGAGSVMSQTSSPGVVDHPRIIYPRSRRQSFVPGAAATLPTLSSATYTPGSITSTGFRPRVTVTF
jgi:hypothetical protein